MFETTGKIQKEIEDTPCPMLRSINSVIKNFEDSTGNTAYLGSPWHRNSVEHESNQQHTVTYGPKSGNLWEVSLFAVNAFSGEKALSEFDSFNGQRGGQAEYLLDQSTTTEIILYPDQSNSLSNISVKNIVLDYISTKVEQTGQKVQHTDIFALFLNAHNGDINAALRDTAYFFRAVTRDDVMRNKSYVADDPYNQLLDIEYFLQTSIEPIDSNNPLPESRSSDMDKDLRNRLGEYYHQYWLLYILQNLSPTQVKSMLDIEYLLEGIGHGKIKKQLDYQLVDEFAQYQKQWFQDRPRISGKPRLGKSLLTFILSENKIVTIKNTPQETTQLIVEDGKLYYIDTNISGQIRKEQVSFLENVK